MASSVVPESDSFLSEAERVREEIRARFSISHEVLRVREAALLSELDELVDSYRGEGVREQIQDLNRIKETMKSTVQRNENQETVASSVALMDERIKALEVSLETAKDRLRRVELAWDGELEERLSELGGIRVIGRNDYRKIGRPLMTARKHSPVKTKESGVFCNPASIVIHLQTKNFYICDSENDRVQVFDSSFRFLFQFRDKMAQPWDICISDNKLFVTQLYGSCLTVYSIEGRLLDSVGKKGEGELEFDWPTGVAVSASKNIIYVCDAKNHRIQCLNLDLTLNSLIPSVFGPTAIRLTQNEIVVLKRGNYCICVFNHSHQFVREVIRCGEDTLLTVPLFFCLDNQSNILMTDFEGHCVVIFSIKGELIHKFGKEGNEQGHLINPTGISLNSDNRVIVLSQNTNYCIQLF